MNFNSIVASLLFTLCMAAAAEAKFFIIEEQNIYTAIWQFASSSPTNNERLDKPPLAVTLNFSAAVNPVNSSISVFDPYNNKLPTGKFVASGNSISVTMPPLTSGYTGTYRVDWQAACQCTDTRLLTGSFYFAIQ